MMDGTRPRLRPCNVCGRRVLAIECPYCQGKFCAEHHHPEAHRCSPRISILRLDSPEEKLASKVETFFRHCPSCGRRFEIILESAKEVETVSSDRSTQKPKLRIGLKPGTIGEFRRRGILVLTYEKTNRFEENKRVKLTFKCGHCGHEWSERRFREAEAETSPEYGGD